MKQRNYKSIYKGVNNGKINIPGLSLIQTRCKNLENQFPFYYRPTTFNSIILQTSSSSTIVDEQICEIYNQ